MKEISHESLDGAILAARVCPCERETDRPIWSAVCTTADHKPTPRATMLCRTDRTRSYGRSRV